MTLDYGSVVTVSVARQIAENIREAILTGQIKVGERLPTEDDLARRFRVSRPTIREALKRLAAQHLVQARRGPAGGNFVTRPDASEAAGSIAGVATLLVSLGAFGLEDIVAARLETETICCRLAATAREDAHLARMEAELAIQRDDSGRISDEEFCASDVRFHRALVDAAGNAPLAFMMHVVIEAMLPVMNLLSLRVRERRIIADHHARIVGALRAREADLATTALKDLIAYSSGLLATVHPPPR
ncbi:MAG: FadR family transcriptional regulator [Telmatospirillum sp.]|nr:FadR family transcriptional regulator [Telmatospirillum sp.]